MSEFATVIEPMTVRAPVRCSNHWATKDSWLAVPYTQFMYDMRPDMPHARDMLINHIIS